MFGIYEEVIKKHRKSDGRQQIYGVRLSARSKGTFLHPLGIHSFNSVEDGKANDDDSDEEQDTGRIVEQFADQDEDSTGNRNDWDKRVKRGAEGTVLLIFLS